MRPKFFTKGTQAVPDFFRGSQGHNKVSSDHVYGHPLGGTHRTEAIPAVPITSQIEPEPACPCGEHPPRRSNAHQPLQLSLSQLALSQKTGLTSLIRQPGIMGNYVLVGASSNVL